MGVRDREVHGRATSPHSRGSSLLENLKFVCVQKLPVWLCDENISGVALFCSSAAFSSFPPCLLFYSITGME